MDDIQIRVAHLTDEPIIHQFISTLEDTVCDPIIFHTIFKQNLTNPLIHYLVAEKAGEVVGFISCHVQFLLHHVGKVGEIQELFVRPDARNQNIGHRLVDAVTMMAFEEKWVSLEVTTNQKRTDTIRFYERELFEATHVKLVKPII